MNSVFVKISVYFFFLLQYIRLDMFENECDVHSFTRK